MVLVIGGGQGFRVPMSSHAIEVGFQSSGSEVIQQQHNWWPAGHHSWRLKRWLALKTGLEIEDDWQLLDFDRRIGRVTQECPVFQSTELYDFSFSSSSFIISSLFTLHANNSDNSESSTPSHHVQRKSCRHDYRNSFMHEEGITMYVLSNNWSMEWPYVQVYRYMFA